MGARRGLMRARRLVVKVGSGLITSPGEGLDGKRGECLHPKWGSRVSDE